MEKTLATRYAEAVDQIDAHRQTISALNEKIVGLESVLTDNELLQAKVTEINTAAVETSVVHENVLTEKAARIDELSAEVEQLKGKLALSPAHIDAGGTKAVDDIPATDKPDAMTYEQAQAEYANITDPKAKADFREKHAVELRLKK